MMEKAKIVGEWRTEVLTSCNAEHHRIVEAGACDSAQRGEVLPPLMARLFIVGKQKDVGHPVLDKESAKLAVWRVCRQNPGIGEGFGKAPAE